ncbi:hypothetical protein GQ54DRAFT_330636 [Martensiomyces pterosporus]|nr:hypothetical protein GQ54DRAFT_330636 [Martensiomyces pterosporus]
MQQQTYTYQPQHSPGHYHQHHRHSASSVPHPYQPQHHSHNHSYSYSYNHSMPIPPPHTPHMQTSRPAGPVSSSPVTPPGIRPVFPGSRPLTAEEKEMKRKVSHSAIEKRRRERTNAVLRELQNIVPGLCKPGKIQKLEILEAAAEYIRQLSAASAIQQQPQRQQQQQKHGQQIQYHPHQQQAQPQGQQGHQPSAVHVPGRGEDVPGANLDQQHLAIATPMSVSSSATAEDSADGGPASGHSTSPPDPSSMKVNFLLC